MRPVIAGSAFLALLGVSPGVTRSQEGDPAWVRLDQVAYPAAASKRALVLNGKQGSRFRLLPSRSTFFQVLDYGDITDERDVDLAQRWTREIGVASIPLSVFCEQPFTGTRLRFCFAKDDATLEEAARRLCAV